MRGSMGIYNQGDWGYGDRRPYHRYAPYTIASKGTTANFTPTGGGCGPQGIMGNVPACQGPEGGLLGTDSAWTYLSPVADLGGPVLKDKLWYYAGWSYTKNNYNRDAIFYADPARELQLRLAMVELPELQPAVAAQQQPPRQVQRRQPAEQEPRHRARTAARERSRSGS
jgi:hypothetical protein